MHASEVSTVRPAYGLHWMIRRHLPQVVRIEAASFRAPWTEEEFYRVLLGSDVIGMVATRDGSALPESVLGFVVYRLRRRSLTLLNLAVAPDARRQGVGTALVGKLVSKLQPDRRRELELYVGERNLAAQLFFKHRGFRATGIIRRRYEESDEDAIRMTYRVAERAESAEARVESQR